MTKIDFGQTRRLKSRWQPLMELLEDRLAPANYTWNGTTGILSISLGTSESLSVTNSGGTRSFALSPGGATFTQAGGDAATGSGGPTLSFTAANNIGTGVTINNVGAAAGTNNVTFSGIGSTDLLTSAAIIVAIGAAAAPSGTIAFTGGFDISATSTISLTTIRDISVGSGSVISTSGSGSVSLSANQQATPTSGSFIGIDVNAGLIQATGTGAVTVQGKGGTGFGNQIGVRAAGGGDIIGGTSGLLTVQGTGGAGTGAINYGVYVTGTSSTITSGGGNVSVTGTGGAATGNFNYGVYVQSAAQITAGGSGTVTVVGQGSNTATGSENHGVYVTGTSSTITSSGGNVSVTGTGGGSGTSEANRGVFVENAAQITAGGSGTVTVVGQGGSLTGTGRGVNYGVYVYGTSSTITSSGGNVSVTGTGGGAGNSFENIGVFLRSGGQITAGGSASTVTVVGQGGNLTGTGGTNSGVYINDTSSTITSSGGNVSVTGTGGGAGSNANSGDNSGVVLGSAGQITAGGSGTVTVVGQGGDLTEISSSNYGVYANGATITSSAGNVSVTGTGGGAGGDRNLGIYIYAIGRITAGGLGTVIVVGQGGGTATFGSNTEGVSFNGATIASNGGNVAVTGTGGGAGNGGFNRGVVVADSQITAGGSGTVTVVGQGGNGTGGSDFGVHVGGATTITSTGGNVSVTGTGGGAGSGNTNHGLVASGGQITAGGNGTVTVVGQGGNLTGTGGVNFGVDLLGTATITSSGGNVSVTGTEGGGSTSTAIVVEGVAAIATATNGGTVTLIGNSMILASAATISASSNSSVTLRQRTDGVAIDLGAATDASGGPLRLSDDELDRVTAGTLFIGDGNSGPITVSSDITRPAATDLRLISGGDIVISGGQVNTAGGPLLLDPGAAPAGLKPTRAGTDVSASTVTFGSAPTISIAINGTTVDSQYTQLNLTGNVDLTGATLALTGAFMPADGNVFTIVSATSRTGLFTGLAENDLVAFNGKQLRVNYTSTTVTLTAVEGQAPVSADLQVTQSDSPDPVVAGQNVTYTVNVLNNGPNAATNVVLTDILPGGVTFVSATGGAVPSNGVLTFNLGTINNGGTGSVTVTVRPNQVGVIRNRASVSAEEQDPDENNNGAAENTTVSPMATQGVSLFITGGGQDGEPRVTVWQPVAARDGSIHTAAGLSFLAYDASFRGGVRVATGDVNRDGIPDIITAPGLGGGSSIRVFDSTTGAQLGGPLSSFDAYGSKYQGGVFVAAADVNGDGFADIITGPQEGKQVKVFSGADGSLLAQLRPYGRNFIKSVHVAAGDVNGDGKADLILGPSGGAEKPVKVYDAVTLNLLYNFFPFDRGYLKGLFVGASDLDGDGLTEIIAGNQVGSARVKVFNGVDGSPRGDFVPFGSEFGGGVRVAAGDVNGDGIADFMTGAGPGQKPGVRFYDGATLAEIDRFFAADLDFRGGIYVSAFTGRGSTAV